MRIRTFMQALGKRDRDRKCVSPTRNAWGLETMFLIIYLIPALQTSDWRMLLTIAFIKHFKVTNLSLYAARQTILPPLSLILLERPVLAVFSVEQLETS